MRVAHVVEDVTRMLRGNGPRGIPALLKECAATADVGLHVDTTAYHSSFYNACDSYFTVVYLYAATLR